MMVHVPPQLIMLTIAVVLLMLFLLIIIRRRREVTIEIEEGKTLDSIKMYREGLDPYLLREYSRMGTRSSDSILKRVLED